MHTLFPALRRVGVERQREEENQIFTRIERIYSCGTKPETFRSRTLYLRESTVESAETAQEVIGQKIKHMHTHTHCLPPSTRPLTRGASAGAAADIVET